MKRVKQALGFVLAGWGVLREGVDLLESIKATREYALAVYDHRFLAMGLFSSRGVTISVLVVGAGLIFSEKIQQAAARVSEKVRPIEANKPNVMFGNTISMQNVVAESGRFRVFVPFESASKMIAITVEVRNPAEDGRIVASAGQVKAQLLFKLKQGDYHIAPGAWLDEAYSSVRLDTGDTRRLIIAVGESFSYGWKMVSNKRADANDHVSLDYTRDVPLLAEGTLEIKLVGSGRVLRTFKTRITWPYQHSLEFAGMEAGGPL